MCMLWVAKKGLALQAAKNMLWECSLYRKTNQSFLKQKLAVGNLIVLPQRESQLHSTITALSSLTSADKEICLSLSKCVLSAKPIKCPFTQLLQQCTPTPPPTHTLPHWTICLNTPDDGPFPVYTYIRRAFHSAYKWHPLLYEHICSLKSLGWLNAHNQNNTKSFHQSTW